MEILLSSPCVANAFLEMFFLKFSVMPVTRFSSSWALALLVLSLHNLTASLKPSWVAWPFFQRWCTSIPEFQPKFSIQPGWWSSLLIFWHLGMACFSAFKISILNHVQPFWTPLPFRTASQGSFSTSIINRPKPALWESCWPPSLFQQKSKSIVLWLLCPR